MIEIGLFCPELCLVLFCFVFVFVFCFFVFVFKSKCPLSRFISGEHVRFVLFVYLCCFVLLVCLFLHLFLITLHLFLTTHIYLHCYCPHNLHEVMLIEIFARHKNKYKNKWSSLNEMSLKSSFWALLNITEVAFSQWYRNHDFSFNLPLFHLFHTTYRITNTKFIPSA